MSQHFTKQGKINTRRSSDWTQTFLAQFHDNVLSKTSATFSPFICSPFAFLFASSSGIPEASYAIKKMLMLFGWFCFCFTYWIVQIFVTDSDRRDKRSKIAGTWNIKCWRLNKFTGVSKKTTSKSISVSISVTAPENGNDLWRSFFLRWVCRIT